MSSTDPTQLVKSKIVDGYRRGVCDHEGQNIPKERRGSAGKGSRFRPAPSEQYRQNYDRIFGDKDNE